jgi:hypothetical protein
MTSKTMHYAQSDQLPKGTRVMLSESGWIADLLDDYQKRPTRLVRVEGIFTECGSIYAAEIVAANFEGRLIHVITTEKHAKVYETARKIMDTISPYNL